MAAIALACLALACGGTEAEPASAAEARPRDGAAQLVELEGELEVTYEDLADGSARLRHVLEAGGERVALLFDGAPPALRSGTRVRASGVWRDGALALESGRSVLALRAGEGADDALVAASTVLPDTFGERRTLVLLVNFEDQPAEPWTVEHARSLVFGTVSDFFREASYGQTWLSGEVHGWFTIALTSTVCDVNALATQADAAARAAGVELSGYAHVVYAFQNACTGRGIGTVGGSPSRAWITGDLRADVVAHELGHGLGLHHSHSRDCGAVSVAPGCTFSEYGHPFDTMGNRSNGHFNAFQKERLGWLGAGASPAIVTATADGTFVLDAYEVPGSSPKALKVLKSVDPATGQRTWYYLEARKAIGFDGFLATNASVPNGVLVSTGSEAGGNTSELLDMTPGSGSLNVYDWADSALPAGQSFRDPDTGLTLTTEWVTPTQAAVSVQMGSEPQQPEAATVTVATDRPSYSRNQTVTVSARVTAAGAAVAGATVSFRVTRPDGAVVTGSGTTASDGRADWKLRLKRQDPAGSWQARATTAEGAGATTTFAVQ